MKDFSNWGIKKRSYPDYNYNAIWNNLKTIRMGSGEAKALPPDHSEFYDIAIGTKCNLNCPFCYANSSKNGRFFTNIVEKVKLFFGTMDNNQKPFQVAIGSSGEPTIHPEFLPFLQYLYEIGIVPNYTTNGITIAENSINGLIDYTEKYCGGVAISINTFSTYIVSRSIAAVCKLLKRDVHTNVHYIVSDKDSINYLKSLWNMFGDDIHTYVLLPMMKHGRSELDMDQEAFSMLQEFLFTLSQEQKEKFAFGANFYPYLINQEHNEKEIKCSLYQPESFSKNLILDDIIRITPSSFNTEVTLFEKKYENDIFI